MQTLPFKQVAVFTQKLFLGNQVAVVIELASGQTVAVLRMPIWLMLL